MKDLLHCPEECIGSWAGSPNLHDFPEVLACQQQWLLDEGLQHSVPGLNGLTTNIDESGIFVVVTSSGSVGRLSARRDGLHPVRWFHLVPRWQWAYGPAIGE